MSKFSYAVYKKVSLKDLVDSKRAHITIARKKATGHTENCLKLLPMEQDVK